MKRTILIVAIIFSLFLVNATPVLEMPSSAQPRETVFAKISTFGTFLETLSVDDITFYDGRKQVYFEHNLYFFNGTYYIDVIFNKEGDFTLKTPEILFEQAGEVGSVTIEKTIPVRYINYDNVTQTATNLLSIKPGTIYTYSNKSELNLFNRGSNTLSIDIGETSIIINPFQARTLYLNLELPLSYVVVSSYKTFSVPIIYLGTPIKVDEVVNETNQTNETEVIVSELYYSSVHTEILSQINQTKTTNIELTNYGNTLITNITLLNNLSLGQITIPTSLAGGVSKNIAITTFSEYPSFINGTINLSYIEKETEFNISIPIQIYVVKENETEPPEVDEELCEDFNGEICDGSCDGESKFTSDGFCCIGTCVAFTTPPPSDDKGGGVSYGLLIGLLIFFVMGIVGYGVYKKYGKTKPDSPDKKLDSSKKKYENRLKGAVARH